MNVSRESPRYEYKLIDKKNVKPNKKPATEKFSLTKLFLSIWIISIVVFGLLLILSLIFQIQDDTANYIISLIIVIGTLAFIVLFFSLLVSGIKRNFIKLIAPITIDKWFALAVITIVIFAFLFYFKIIKDNNKVIQKEQTPSVMDCLKLGSDVARKACIKYYQPKR